MDLKDLIRTRRLALNLSQEELGRRCGVSRQAVGDWEKGVSAPTRKRAKLVAAALRLERSAIEPFAVSNVSESGRDILPSREYTGSVNAMGGHEIPLISLERIGERVVMLQEAARIEVDATVPLDAQAFTVSDNSMTPIYNVGDVIIVSASIAPRDGDDVVAKLDNVNVFRRYRPRGEAYDLVPLSPEYSTVTIRRDSAGPSLAVMVERRQKRRP